MASSDDDGSSSLPGTEKSSLVEYARWGSGIAATLCGVLAAIVMGATVWALTALGEHHEAALGVGMTFFVFLPIASIPVALVCLIAAVISIRALGSNGGSRAERSLWLSVGSPFGVFLLYAVCVLIVMSA